MQKNDSLNEKMSDYYADCSNYSRNASTEHDTKLCEILITASLAFLAIISSTLGAIEEKSLSSVGGHFLIFSIISFISSVSVGIVHIFRTISFFNRVSGIQGKASNLLLENHTNDAKSQLEELGKTKNQSTGGASLLAQAILFGAGVLFVSAEICLSICSILSSS